MLYRFPEPRPSEITPQPVFESRREFIKALGLGAAALAAGRSVSAPRALAVAGEPAGRFSRNPRWTTNEPLTTYEDVTSYNNFYEFGTEKSDPRENSRAFRARPWSVAIAGEAEVQGTFTLEDLLKPHALEERVYRFRCVEAWSMVVPWLGFPLGDLLQRFKPTSRAKFVEFTTLLDPKQMPGQRARIIEWPYVEGLRMDEATHPLSMMVVGVYGRWLPNQNGAPLRLVVPWKYGFKSIKSIVRIRFTERQPRTSWSDMAPNEYGFFANVNPAVDHPRWSQAKERRIGSGFFAPRIDTLPFNGYASEVAALYRGMDLRRFY